MSHRLARIACLICLVLLIARPAWSGPPKANVQRRTDPYGDPLPPGAVARMGSVLFYHGLAATKLAFSPDGKILAVSGGGGNNFNIISPFDGHNCIRLLDAATGRQLHQLEGHCDTDSLRFSPDGKRLISKGDDGRVWDIIKIWDVATGKELYHLRGDTLTHDGQNLIRAAEENDRVTIRFVNIATGKELRRITVPHMGVSKLVSAPDDKTLAGRVSTDDSIYIWDAATGKELHRMAGIEKYDVDRLAYSPSSETLAALFLGGKTVKLWDTATGKELHQWSGSPKFGSVTPAFSSDGKILAVAGPDETVQLCDVRTGKETIRLKVPEASIVGIAFSPDGKKLAWGTRGGADGRSVHFWDLAEKKEQRPPGRLPRPIEVVAFSPDGKTLLTSGDVDEPVRSWEVATGKELRQFKRPKSSDPPIISSSGRLIAVRGEKPQILSPTTGMRVTLRGKLLDYLSPATFSPDERLLAVGDEKTIRVFDTATGEECRTLGKLRRRPWYIAFTADSKTLLGRIVDEDGSNIKVWDVTTGKLLRRVKGVDLTRMHPKYMTFSPDGRLVAGVLWKSDQTGAFVEDVRIVMGNLAMGEVVRELRADPSIVRCLAFSPDGRSLACVYEVGGVIRLWEVATGQERRHFEGHRQVVSCLVFSADGSLLATGAEDNTAIVWDLTGQLDNGPAAQSDLSTERLQAMWADLAAKDAGVAYRAMCHLLAGRQAVAFLRERLRPVAALDARQREQVARWIADLDNSQFDAREKAAAELERLGEPAESALREVLADKPSLEMRRRAKPILDSLDLARSPQRLQALRAVEVLERCGTSEAREFLKEIAKGAPEARLTQEAKATLERWERRSALAAGK